MSRRPSRHGTKVGSATRRTGQRAVAVPRLHPAPSGRQQRQRGGRVVLLAWRLRDHRRRPWLRAAAADGYATAAERPGSDEAGRGSDPGGRQLRPRPPQHRPVPARPSAHVRGGPRDADHQVDAQERTAKTAVSEPVPAVPKAAPAGHKAAAKKAAAPAKKAPPAKKAAAPKPATAPSKKAPAKKSTSKKVAAKTVLTRDSDQGDRPAATKRTRSGRTRQQISSTS